MKFLIDKEQLITDLGDKVREMGIRSPQIANLLGISSSTVRTWFSGNRDVPDRWALALACHFNMKPLKYVVFEGELGDTVPAYEARAQLDNANNAALLLEAKLRTSDALLAEAHQHIAFLESDRQHVEAAGKYAADRILVMQDGLDWKERAQRLEGQCDELAAKHRALQKQTLKTRLAALPR